MSERVLPAPEAGPAAAASEAPGTVAAPAGDVKELRLGLVLYGGVSLAIYMHGITKEIHRAVRASVLEEHELASGPDAASEGAYRAVAPGAARRARRPDARRRRHDRRLVGRRDQRHLPREGAGRATSSRSATRSLVRRTATSRRSFTTLPARGGGSRSGLRTCFRSATGVPRREAREKLLVAALHVREHPLLDGDEMAR